MNAIVAHFRQRFAAERNAVPTPEQITDMMMALNAYKPDRPKPHPIPATAAAFHALEAIPAYWHGRAMGRLQASDVMDLSRDHLADHQAIAQYERLAITGEATEKGK